MENLTDLIDLTAAAIEDKLRKESTVLADISEADLATFRTAMGFKAQSIHYELAGQPVDQETQASIDAQMADMKSVSSAMLNDRLQEVLTGMARKAFKLP